jgi:monofunctional glycosyltransferase
MLAHSILPRMKRTLLVVSAVGLLVAGYGVYLVSGIPSRQAVRALSWRRPETTGVMRQREEEARKTGRRLQVHQTFVPLSRISRHLINAVVVAEDPKFFGHEGIDWAAIRESVEIDVRKRRFFRGGSTITQQLAKNLFFTTRKSITRKLRELFVTRWLEDDLSKKRILELYLNVIEWGDGTFGCEAAAQRYFGMSASDLGPEEAAGLAAMIPSPRRINPRTSPTRYAHAQRRILWLMEHAGYVKRNVAGLGAVPPEPSTEPTQDDESGSPDDEAAGSDPM